MSESSQLILYALLLGLLPVALLFGRLRRFEGSARHWLAGCLVVVLSLTAVLYTQLGAWVDLKIRDDYQALLERMSAGAEVAPGERQALLQRMARRAEATDDPDYYYLLANEYRAGEEFETASGYFAKVAEVWPDDSSILSAWAETEFMAQGFLMTPKVQDLVDRTLRVDPNNATVLGVLGINAFRSAEYADAIEYWSRILVGLPPMSPNRGVLQQSIDRASQMLDQSGGVPPAVASSANPAGENQVQVMLDVSLRGGLDVSPSAAVFVFARVPGSPMPLAVQRLDPASLPTRVTLDDSMVMIPGTSLAGMPQLELVARLSQSGQPVAQPGDAEGKVTVSREQLESEISLEIGENVE